MSDSYWDAKPDLTRLPHQLKGTLDKPIPLRPTEVRARVVVTSTVGQNHPSGRLLIAPHKPDNENPGLVEGVSIEFMDYGAKRPLAVALLTPENFATALKGGLAAYQRSGGSLDTIREMIEEIENGRRDR